ncbi:MAG: 50S ribosomal protein L21 [Patescibacteria group bacterium]
MLDYAICEISGKQYRVFPNQPFIVDRLNDREKKTEALVLMLAENGKVKIGTPYLKEKLTLDIIEMVKGDKIRVAKFHAKANYRKVTGIRPRKTELIYTVKK